MKFLVAIYCIVELILNWYSIFISDSLLCRFGSYIDTVCNTVPRCNRFWNRFQWFATNFAESSCFMWGQAHVRPKNENILKNFFSLQWSLSYFDVVFYEMLFFAKFKILVLETPVNRSLPFFQGVSFIVPLNYTPQFRSLSQKLWPQAIVQ
jgi:hypothetical protein